MNTINTVFKITPQVLPRIIKKHPVHKDKIILFTDHIILLTGNPYSLTSQFEIINEFCKIVDHEINIK